MLLLVCARRQVAKDWSAPLRLFKTNLPDVFLPPFLNHVRIKRRFALLHLAIVGPGQHGDHDQCKQRQQ
jgi:hypothetical protein